MDKELVAFMAQQEINPQLLENVKTLLSCRRVAAFGLNSAAAWDDYQKQIMIAEIESCNSKLKILLGIY